MAGLSSENKLRDIYNIRIVKIFAKRIKKTYPAFNERGFVMAIQATL